MEPLAPKHELALRTDLRLLEKILAAAMTNTFSSMLAEQLLILAKDLGTKSEEEEAG